MALTPEQYRYLIYRSLDVPLAVTRPHDAARWKLEQLANLPDEHFYNSQEPDVIPFMVNTLVAGELDSVILGRPLDVERLASRLGQKAAPGDPGTATKLIAQVLHALDHHMREHAYEMPPEYPDYI